MHSSRINFENLSTAEYTFSIPFTIINDVFLFPRNLCDMKGMGKLTSDQFALAVHLMQQKLKGVDPPQSLTPELIPPSMRPQATPADTAAFGVAVSIHPNYFHPLYWPVGLH